MNILNPALTARIFLFAYPVDISGDRVWVSGSASGEWIDGVIGATRWRSSTPTATPPRPWPRPGP